MQRRHRIVLTVVAASTAAAGAASAVVLTSPSGVAPAQPQLQPAAQALPGEPDPSALHDSITRLSGEVATLKAELQDKERRLEAERKARAEEARRAADAQRAAAQAAAARATAARAAPKPARAPAVHTRTGASSGAAGGERETESGDD